MVDAQMTGKFSSRGSQMRGGGEARTEGWRGVRGGDGASKSPALTLAVTVGCTEIRSKGVWVLCIISGACGGYAAWGCEWGSRLLGRRWRTCGNAGCDNSVPCGNGGGSRPLGRRLCEYSAARLPPAYGKRQPALALLLLHPACSPLLIYTISWPLIFQEHPAFL